MILLKIVQAFKNPRSIPFFSFLLGIGTVIMLFHRPFEKRNTLAMPVGEVENKIVKIDGKCFKYVAEDVQCEIPSHK
jgi:hypothetical protein